MKNKHIYKKLLINIILVMLIASVILNNVSADINSSKNNLKNVKNQFYENDCTIYVDDDNIMGPWNGSFEYPYRYIQDGIDNALMNDCICVMNGTYSENIVIKNQTMNGIIIKGENKNTAIIDGGNKDSTHTIFLSMVNDITITNFTIIGSGLNYDNSKYLFDGIFCQDSDNIIIENNIVRGNGNGIGGDSNSFLVIRNNTIEQNECDGIRGHSKYIICCNQIKNNGYGEGPNQPNGDGISLWSSAERSIIDNNIISNNRIDGIWDEGVDNHQITNNTINGNGQSGIHLNEGRLCLIQNNIIENNGFGSEISGYYGSGIQLFQSTINIIENNKITNNKKGIHIRQSQSNDVLNNEITGNTISGVSIVETASNEIKYNLIIENQIGCVAIMASDFKLNYNDIFLNSMVGLFTFNGFGSATNNYWGSAWGPIPFVGTFRIIPPFPSVRPWSIFPNIDDN